MKTCPKIGLAAAAAMAAFSIAAPAGAAQLLTNGDFEAKNAGFYSAYGYASDHNLWPEGMFDTVRNPILTHSAFVSMHDHTPVDVVGRMMVVNGAPRPDEVIWGEGDLGSGASLNGAAGSAFEFSFWLATVTAISPANLQLWVTGDKVQGVTFAALGGASNLGIWRQYSYAGVAGSGGLRSIALTNNNLAPYGNDFALDDMSLIGTLAQAYVPPPPAPPPLDPPPGAPIVEDAPPPPPPPIAPIVGPGPPPPPVILASTPEADPPTQPMGAVPEPATWAMLILGFGAVGAVLRRRYAAAA